MNKVMKLSAGRRRGKGQGAVTAVERGGIAIVDEDGTPIHVAPPKIAASIRYLVARLQLNDVTGLPVRLALTSAVRGEGVSYVARTLAAVVAHDLERSVCIVDLNWWTSRAPTEPRDDVRGLADVVDGKATLDDVLVATADSSLWLAPAGDVAVARRPVVAKNPALDQVVDDLARLFDHVVLELPPVLVTSDALTLARLCDAYALVVKQGVTTDHQVQRAVQELSGAVSLGIVLNRSSSRIPQRIARLLAS
jgi:Mrp family chromosome partitioning ATPase